MPTIQAFYDSRLERQLEDFVVGNRRVECAWETVERFAPAEPERILEIGCGIGGISWRISRRWPRADVVGLDPAPELVRTAKALFESPQVAFVEGELRPKLIPGRFDLVLLMDVYEHIARADREEFHEALAGVLRDESRIVVSAPTPRHLDWLRAHHPDEIQPVDEDVAFDVLLALAAETATELTLYREVDVWHQGDYLHAVFMRRQGFNPVEPRSEPRALPRLLRVRSDGASARKERAALVRARLGHSVE